ncbi:MAG: helix-turn-helix domain-containing protein [Planctomycetota bacterium]
MWHAECTENGESNVKHEFADWTVFGRPAGYGENPAKGGRVRTLAGKTIGLTTGQAARYCLVSPDTIVKWIRAENLPAQRTVGGQFRIFVDGLREFMIRNQMSTERLDAEIDCRPYCWEYHHGTRRAASTPGLPCGECPVYRAKALNCFELRAIDADCSWPDRNCADCAYYRTWADSSGAETQHGGGSRRA